MSRKSRRAKRKAKQRAREYYAVTREDAQLAGDVPTTPAGALREERVLPSEQSEQPLPQLTARAIRHGWSVPDERKPELIDELIRIVNDPDMPSKVKVAAFNALRQADQAQYERDHPKQGVTGGTTTQINIIDRAAIIQEQLRIAAMGESLQDDGNRELLDKTDSNGETGGVP